MPVKYCERCGYTWRARVERPKCCPRCGVRDYDLPKSHNVSYPLINGYIPVTKVFRDKADLADWYQWLNNKGLKAKYVRVGPYWAVYRKEEE
jgi:hypothetical protein